MRLVEWMVLVGIVVIGEGHHVVVVAFIFGQGQPRFGFQSVVAPRKPFYGDFGMVDVALPSQEGFGGDGLGRETVHAWVPIARQPAVICSKGLKAACDSKSCLNVKQPCIKSFMSDSQ